MNAAVPKESVALCVNEGGVGDLFDRLGLVIEHVRKVSATPDELRRAADWIERTSAGQHP